MKFLLKKRTKPSHLAGVTYCALNKDALAINTVLIFEGVCL